MRRRLLKLASAISLLLCFATVVLWVRSYLRVDEVTRFMSRYGEAGASDRSVMSAFGVIRAYELSVGTVDGSPPPVVWVRKSRLADDAVRQKMALPLPRYLNREIQVGGYGVAYSADAEGIIQAELRIPYWPPAVLFALLPGVWIWGWIGRRGSVGPRCRRCRYNLTGNTSGVCPECGEAVAGKTEGVA